MSQHYSIIAFLDIDECNTGSHNCDVNANCTNTFGGHNCTCKEGFAGDGRSCSGTLSCKKDETGRKRCVTNSLLKKYAELTLLVIVYCTPT